MKKISLLLSIAGLLITGCTTKQLDQKTALSIIKTSRGYPIVKDYDLFCADPKYARKVLDSGLEKQGLLTVQRTQKLRDIGKPLIHFTDKARPYLLPTPKEDKVSNIQKVKLADEMINEITRIKTSSDGKKAIVEYTTVYKHITPFAVLLKGGLHKPNTVKVYLSKQK